MSKVCVFDHPLIQHKLSILREKSTSVKEFRELISEIAMLMCYEATRDLPLKEISLETPLAHTLARVITGKKLAFVSQSVEELGLSANIVHARAEEAGQGELRESFDFAVSRAVAAMNILCEYCLPFVKVGGTFCAMKGAKGAEELDCAGKAIATLGGETQKTETLILPDGGERVLINVKKISHTATKYPRPSAQISKKPLV